MARSMDGMNVHAIRDLVHTELCEQNQLEKNAFPMSERILVKQGQPCGLFFCLHGPRSVRLTAVWDMCRSAIFYYDSKGERSGQRVVTSDMAAMATGQS